MDRAKEREKTCAASYEIIIPSSESLLLVELALPPDTEPPPPLGAAMGAATGAAIGATPEASLEASAAGTGPDLGPDLTRSVRGWGEGGREKGG